MNLKIKAIVPCIVAILFSSCSDESPFNSSNSSDKGKIQLNLTSSAEINRETPLVRSVSTDISVPDASLFQIRLSSLDGSYTKVWTSLEDFAKEESFPVGTYTLEAFYGDKNSQGVVAEGEEGHEHAFYYAIQEELKVAGGETTAVQLEAKLANSIVVVEYTDAFKKYFTAWETSLKNSSAAAIQIGDKEALSYIKSGEISVSITAELQNGNRVRLTPTDFTAEPQHLYKITYNVYNGEIGEVDKLEIIFNDDLENGSNVTVDLTEELFMDSEPVVSLEGINGDMEYLEGYPSTEEDKIEFFVNAPEGIESAYLNVVTLSTLPSVFTDGSLNLCEKDANLLSKAGLKALGFFNQPDRYATLEITEFCKSLAAGEYEITLIVTDKYKRNGSASFKVSVSPIDVKISPVFVDDQPLVLKFGDTEAEVIVSYNGPDPTLPGQNPFKFKVTGLVKYEDVEVVAINGEQLTRSYESKQYKYRIKLPVDGNGYPAPRDEYSVKLYYGEHEQEIGEPVTMDVIYPSYEMEYDALSSKLMMRIKEGTISSQLYDMAQNRLRVFIDEKEVSNSNWQIKNGIISISGLSPSSQVSVKTTIESKNSPVNFFGEAIIDLEPIVQIPNSEFEDSENYINQEIDRGGKYYVSWSDSNHQDKDSYSYDQPLDWANVNEKTCNFSNSNRINTWFVVPSTYIDSGFSGNAVSIRSVGYNYNGPSLASDGSLGNAKSYNTKSPAKGYTAAGKLFLGDYSISISNYAFQSESYNQGIEFKSRPLKFSGKFKYKPCSNSDDQGWVEISLWNGNTELLNKKLYFDSQENWDDFSIDLTSDSYPAFNVKPTTLKVMFCSSKYASENWNSENENVPTVAITETTQKFLGSELTIDNLKLEY